MYSIDLYKPPSSNYYTIWYEPHCVFEEGRQEKAYWEQDSLDCNKGKWLIPYIRTPETYKITHWDFMPEKPKKEDCENGMVYSVEEGKID